MKVGVISDTHNVLREEVLDYLKDCDYIIHAGDVCQVEIMERLNQIAKTFVVAGNNDKALDLPKDLEIELGEILIYVVHDKLDIPKNMNHVNLIIYGHSHKFEYEEREGIKYLNPGGCGRRRFSLPLTMAILHLNDDHMEIEKIDLQY